MTPQEAYKLLELSQDVSDDDLKKEWRKKAYKFHPDRYKEDPNKLKDINEAYQFIKNYRENPQPQHSFEQQGFGNIQDILNHFVGTQQQQQSKSHNFPPVVIPINLTFKESVLGSIKDLEYNKFIKCNTCNGQGREAQSNGCKNCNGFGRITTNQGQMIYTSQCNKCYGRNIKFNNCAPCKSKGFVDSKVNVKINIPPGVPNNANLRMRGLGHFAGGGDMFGDQYSDAISHITVEKNKDLILDGQDVVCNLHISLKEALEGCKKTVPTVNEDKEIILEKLIKNKDEIKLDKLGVPPTGSQRVIINIDYPKGEVLEKIMKILEENK